MKFLIFHILFITAYISAQEKYFLPSNSKGEIVHHSEFSLSYIEEHEQSEWVAYKLTKTMIDSGYVNRTNRFRVDKSISTGSAHPDDYKYSGYDRGHLCPAGDMKHSETAMQESFFMSNISPQIPSFNRSMWRRLEDRVRQWGIENDSLFICVGGVLKDSLKKIGPNSTISVPEYFYKVILSTKSNEEKAIAFLFENKALNGKIEQFAVTVDSVESFTGLDFYPFLEDSLENYLESNLNLSNWSFEEIKKSAKESSEIRQTEKKEKVEFEQCRAITKSGTQCKRKGVFDGYCYQHKVNE